jgi:hypothetical protein
MPISPFQQSVLRLLAGQRLPESHVAGGAAINRSSSSPRFSADIDIFHDVADDVRAAAECDARILDSVGYKVTWQLRQASLQRAQVERDGQLMKLEWCHDSSFRFFPVQPDTDFGYALHPADLATNKALALAGRSEVRDFIDILFLHESYLSLGAICWAACGKDEGFNPSSLLGYAKAHMKFREQDLSSEHLARPLVLADLKDAWQRAVAQAEELFVRLPASEVGCLYLAPTMIPITPDPADAGFARVIRHFGSTRGAWPVVA